MEHMLIFSVICSLVQFVEFLKSVVQLVHPLSILNHFIVWLQFPSLLNPAVNVTFSLAALINRSVMSTFSVGWNISVFPSNSLPLDVGNFSCKRINNHLAPHFGSQAITIGKHIFLYFSITCELIGGRGGTCPSSSSPGKAATSCSDNGWI